MPRGPYKKNSAADKARILRCAQDGDDWKILPRTLNVAYKTAHCWLLEDPDVQRRRRGGKAKKLTDEQINQVCMFIEEDPSLTLKQIADRVQETMNIVVSPSTVMRPE